MADKDKIEPKDTKDATKAEIAAAKAGKVPPAPDPDKLIKDAEVEAQAILDDAANEAAALREEAVEATAKTKLKEAGDMANRAVLFRADRDTLEEGTIVGASITEDGTFYDVQTPTKLHLKARLSPLAREAGEFKLVEVK